MQQELAKFILISLNLRLPIIQHDKKIKMWPKTTLIFQMQNILQKENHRII